MVGNTGKIAAVLLAAALFGAGAEALAQTRTRRSIEGPVTRESVVRGLSVIPVEESVGTRDRIDTRPPVQSGRLGPVSSIPGAPVELSVMLRINFALESANLTPGALRDLDQVAAALRDPRLADVPVTLEGHTDASGAADYNLDLSRRRAGAVLAYLTSRGVRPDRLRAVGYGEHRLLREYSPTDGLQRRVEIVRTF